MSADCLFCKLINREIPAEILYEDEFALAFSDINPQAPEHFLVIPKLHINTLNDIEPEHTQAVGHLQYVAAKVAADKGIASDGFRTVMNCNTNGGQTVYHIHLHVLGGKPLGWPPYQDKLKTA